MKGHPDIIQALNEVLKGELTAINQYFLHSKMCKDWGFGALADKLYKESIEEMRHADELTERILFLEGLPNLQALDKLNIGETVEEQLEADLEIETKARDLLKKCIELSFKHEDHVSRALFQKILSDEEEHIDWIETQQQAITVVSVYITIDFEPSNSIEACR